ncbi:MAG: threonine/serine dehydratase [Francisellaceae bacterium]
MNAISYALNEIKMEHKRLSSYVNMTPTINWNSVFKENCFGNATNISMKLELFQKTGVFKLRGALSRLLNLSDAEKSSGVVTGTGGNHGVALSYGAKLLGINAKIVVPESINPYRLSQIKANGAKVVTVSDIAEVIDEMRRLAEIERRTIIHPFDHPQVTLATATLGYEWMQQIEKPDIVFVAVGGGGLISGVSMAVKTMYPGCTVLGVEPKTANVMQQSFKNGHALKPDLRQFSIADSLSAPYTEKYSFSICKRFVDDIITVSDDEIKAAMNILFHDCKLAVEPAGAAALAGLLKMESKDIVGKKASIIICGSNIDHDTFKNQLY